MFLARAESGLFLQMQPVTGHLSDVWCVAFSADAKRVVSGSREGTVKIWDVATGAEVSTLVNLPQYG